MNVHNIERPTTEELRSECLRRQIKPGDENLGRPACQGLLEAGMHGPVLYCSTSTNCPNREPFFHGDHALAEDPSPEPTISPAPIVQPVTLRLVR